MVEQARRCCQIAGLRAHARIRRWQRRLALRRVPSGPLRIDVGQAFCPAFPFKSCPAQKREKPRISPRPFWIAGATLRALAEIIAAVRVCAPATIRIVD